MDRDASDGQDGAGRAVVNRLLINRLTDAGLRAPKGQTAAALADVLQHLADRLDHMTPDNLATLADTVLDHAARPGSDQGRWPREVLIIGWADALQPRPWQMKRIVSSWLASVRGPEAEAGGWLVQLYRFLRDKPRAPLPGDILQLQRQSGDDNRTQQMIRDRMARGVQREDDRQWLADYLADEAQARAFVDHGRAKRAATVSPNPDEAAA